MKTPCFPLLVGLHAVAAFLPQSLKTIRSVISPKFGNDRLIQNNNEQQATLNSFGSTITSSWSNDDVCSSSTKLNMAFATETPTNIFDGPMALTQERDACGVGFIANTNEKDGTHKVVEQGLWALGCMEHRGACGGDRVSGDGAGVMTQIPWKLFSQYRSDVDTNHGVGVGMVFLPRNELKRKDVMKIIEDTCTVNELQFLGWREVPVDPSVLGERARTAQPHIMQFFVKSPDRLKDDDVDRDGFERTLYLVRRRFSVEVEKSGIDLGDEEMYVASFSSRTIVYKGMVQSSVLPMFYKDLTDPNYTSQFIIYHRRFSTNTNPRWPLAQPMRVLGHNGEINTLLGNVNWVKAREAQKSQEFAIDFVDVESTENIVTMCDTQDIPSILEPVVDLARSDSANLDSVFELMCQSRHRAPCALMAMVPSAYMNNPNVDKFPEIADFYKFHGGLLEAWDGPALLVYSDGKSIGAALDRNGLRPARYSISKDGSVYLMSETGVIPNLDEADIVEKGRLGPGHMINVDLTTGEFKNNLKIKSEIAKRKIRLLYICLLCAHLNVFFNISLTSFFFLPCTK